MNAKPMISSTKLVYSNDLFSIYIATNSEQESPLCSRKPAFVYFKGEFYSMKRSSIEQCSRAQTEYLLSVMTRFGAF
jgi:hypothetical protein